MGRLRQVRGRLAIALAVSLIGAGAMAAIALAQGTSGPRPSRADEAAQLLRLTDLPLGYETLELEEDRGHVAECEAFTEPDDTPAAMLRFIRRYHPRGCLFGFAYAYGEKEAGRNPLLVGTGVMDAGSKAAAAAAWAVVPEMLGRLLGDKAPREVKAPARIGDATRLFHAHARIYGSHAVEPVTFLVWRSGDTLAAVLSADRPFAIDDAAAELLAARQQVHIAKPTRLKAADNYDGEVALEDPALDLPVYWLGRRFKTGGGVADARLGSSWFAEKPIAERSEGGFAEGPLPKLRLTYWNPTDLTLSIWGPEDWPVYAHSRTAKAIVSWKCTRTRTIEVPGGTATIYLGYAKDYAKCPARKPRSATAWVKFGEDTVVVDEPFAADSVEPDSPWGSFAAMEAVVKGLRLRP
jgi:hypothetical protein